MAKILKNNSFMALPSSIRRGNPAPLDITEIWFSYTEMADYATNNDTAYVGQQMALVDENEKTAKVYIILNTDGDLQEIGTDILTDDLSVEISNEGAITLYGFGTQYYRFVEAVDDEPAHYELQDVDVEHPWSAGLEPRVVAEGGKLVLGWFEPNPTTVDGIQNQVTAVQGAVANLEQATETLETDVNKAEESITNLETSVEELEDKIGDPTNSDLGTEASGLYAELETKANAEDVYTITQANKAIADAVAGASHLKRKIMGSLEEVEAYAAINNDAIQYIFMVSNGLQADDNRYYEYMVFEIAGEDGAEPTRVVERVGNWAVDLSGYATTGALENLTQTVADNKSTIEQALADEAARADTAEKALSDRIDAIDFIDSDELATALEPYAKTADVNSALDEKADAATTLAGYGITDAYTKAEADKVIADKVADVTGGESAAAVKLLLEAEVTRSTQKDEAHDTAINTITEKLNSISTGAQVNVIDAVNETEFTLEDKVLGVREVTATKISGLEEHSALTSLKALIDGNTNEITNVKTSVTSISDQLNNFVLKTAYEAEMAEIKNAITWHEV